MSITKKLELEEEIQEARDYIQDILLEYSLNPNYYNNEIWKMIDILVDRERKLACLKK